MAKTEAAPAGAEKAPADAGSAAGGANGGATGGAEKKKEKKKTDEEEKKKADGAEDEDDLDDDDAKKKKEEEAKKRLASGLKAGEELFHANMHPHYKQYFKQLLSGVPIGTIEAAMKRKNLNPEVLKTPKLRIVYKGKPQKKKTAMEILAEEEARQAIIAEDDAEKRAKELHNPLDDIDWDKPEFKGLFGMIRKARAYAKAKKDILAAAAFKYGPPYQEDYGGSILEECNKPQSSALDVHQMLLDGADPNVVDDGEEAFENTPMHYAGRYCHPYIAKMLVRAKAHPDKPNAVGVTPLGTLCMFNQPPDRRSTHLKMVKWLLELEFKRNDEDKDEVPLKVDVNHVDKGGHTALEFAAKHGNVELVACLIKFGARVKRDAQFISLKSVDLLDPEICWDSTCRQLIKVKYNEEVRVEQELIKAAKQKRIEEEAAERDRERALAIARRHDEKNNSANDKYAYERQLQIDNLKKKNREDAKKNRLKLLEERRSDGGSWMKKKGESRRGMHDSEWHFVEGVKNGGVISGSVYDEASWMSKQMVEKHSFAVMSKRWKEVTGHGLLQRQDVTDMGYGIDEELKDIRDKRREEEALFGNPSAAPAEGGIEDISDEESTGAFAGRYSKPREDEAVGGGSDKAVLVDPAMAALGAKIAERRKSITGAGFKMPKLF